MRSAPTGLPERKPKKKGAAPLCGRGKRGGFLLRIATEPAGGLAAAAAEAAAGQPAKPARPSGKLGVSALLALRENRGVVGGCGERGGTSGRAWLTPALKRGLPLPRRRGSLWTELQVLRGAAREVCRPWGRKAVERDNLSGDPRQLLGAVPALPRLPLSPSEACPCLPCPPGVLPPGQPSAPSVSDLPFLLSSLRPGGWVSRLVGRAWMRTRGAPSLGTCGRVRH